ncbi:MAG: VPLPA-CTERM sorting domain-containing protein [Pseudomonadota bacterium]
MFKFVSAFTVGGLLLAGTAHAVPVTPGTVFSLDFETTDAGEGASLTPDQIANGDPDPNPDADNDPRTGGDISRPGQVVNGLDQLFEEDFGVTLSAISNGQVSSNPLVLFDSACFTPTNGNRAPDPNIPSCTSTPTGGNPGDPDLGTGETFGTPAANKVLIAQETGSGGSSATNDLGDYTRPDDATTFDILAEYDLTRYEFGITFDRAILIDANVSEEDPIFTATKIDGRIFTTSASGAPSGAIVGDFVEQDLFWGDPGSGPNGTTPTLAESTFEAASQAEANAVCPGAVLVSGGGGNDYRCIGENAYRTFVFDQEITQNLQSFEINFAGSGAIELLQWRASAEVPLPPAAFLLAGALAGLAYFRRRQQVAEA